MQMNVFSINNRRIMNIDNPPDDGGGSDESEMVADGPEEASKEPDTWLDAIIDAIAAIAEKVDALSDRMDAFVDAGAVVRESDDGEDVGDEDGIVDEEDLETAIEDMDFSLDTDEN